MVNFGGDWFLDWGWFGALGAGDRRCFMPNARLLYGARTATRDNARECQRRQSEGERKPTSARRCGKKKNGTRVLVAPSLRLVLRDPHRQAATLLQTCSACSCPLVTEPLTYWRDLRASLGNACQTLSSRQSV